MAIKLPKFFSRLDARARIFFLFAGAVAAIFLVYLGVRFFWGEGSTAGPSSVAGVPAGVQSVPGGQVTPEYARALQQANIQAAQQAKMTGTSAVPTIFRVESPQAATSGAACVICDDESANVKYKLGDWVRQGKISPDIADTLQQLAGKNVSVDEYARQLSQLVKDGKVTPEQARELLEEYKKQRANTLLKESAQVMDKMISAGQLPLDVANQLLTAQKNKVSPAEYSAMLQDFVKQGKISPSVAQQLLAQYTQQRTKEAADEGLATLARMVQTGEMTSEVAKILGDLQSQNVPLDTYEKTLQKLVSEGKLTPATAAKLLEQYRSQKTVIGPIGSISQKLQQAEASAYGELSDLLKQRKISSEIAETLTDLIQKDVSFDTFQSTVNQFVQQNKLSADIAKLKLADYRLVKGLRDLTNKLGVLQANNSSPGVYANELKRAVQDGLITPEEAAQLMKEYQAISAPSPTVAGGTGNLQQLLQAETSYKAAPVPTDFAVVQTQAQQQSTQENLANIEQIRSEMTNQAQQLITSWQPPSMMHKAAMPTTKTASVLGDGKKSEEKGGLFSGAGGASLSVMIKAGTVYFAVLDTGVNSDYPDSPIMATIVDGKYKGAKLLGKIVLTKGPVGQMDRVTLNFTSMNIEDWPASKTVSAYGIDPDTARTVMASNVDYHYAQRFGALMATSFLQGYASAVTTSGGSTSQTLIGTTTTNPALNPSQKIMVGLGQVGQALGTAVQNYANLPPTVKVDSGVGLGILFMSDVSA